MPANPLGVLLRNRRAGHHTLLWARPDLQAPETFALTSPAFDHGAPIPDTYRGRMRGPNVSPALAWTTPPADTAELALIVQDPDVPIGKPATHALTIGIDPASAGILENGLTDPSPITGLRHGRGPLGHRGWAGPMPRARTGRTPTSSSSSRSTITPSCPRGSRSPTCSRPCPGTSSHAPDSTAPTRSGSRPRHRLLTE